MLRRWLIFGFGIVGMALVLTGVYAWTSRPDTYSDAVREALDRRQIAYTGLEVREICLPDPTCVINADGTHTFAAVVVHGSAASAGQIACYDRRGDCYLALPSLDIQRAPLRDLRGVRWLPRQVVQEIARIVGWLRRPCWRRSATPASANNANSANTSIALSRRLALCADRS
jgi:hypothetical protein